MSFFKSQFFMKKLYLFLFFITLTNLTEAQQTADCNAATSQSYLHINQIKAHLSSGGKVWGWTSTGRPAYIVDSTKSGIPLSTIFTSAIWLGAIDEANGALKVAATTYSQSGNDFWPGPIDNETQSTDYVQCSKYDKHWKVHKVSIDKFIAGEQLTEEEENEIYKWPGKGNSHFNLNHLNQSIAPFYDVDGDDIYNPDNGDYPKIKGDQAVWWIISDIGNDHKETGGEALGVEIKKMAYAFGSEQQLENSTFLEIEITNKSSNSYKDFLLGYWVDFDLGNFGDDFIGCDTLNAIAYAYNGDDYDDTAEGFGYEIPLQGCQFLDVPPNYYGNENDMFAFVYYTGDFSNISNPNSTEHYYTFLQGLWKNGNPITTGGNGTSSNNPITRYMYSSNPPDTDGWSECSMGNEPADRRIITSSGKYKFASGETKTWTLCAHTIHNVGGICPDVQPLIDQAAYAKTFFENFVLVDVKDNFENEKALVYPNPAKNKLYFKTNPSVKIVEVYSVDGQLILQKNINANYLNIGDLSNGWYNAKLFGNDGKVYRAKFMKE